MKLVARSAILALSLLTFACGDDDDDNDDVIEQIPNQLAGTYRSSCLPNSVLSLSHATREISFRVNGGFDKKEVYFSDACSTAPALVYKVNGTVQTAGSLPSNPELEQINFQVNDAWITIGTQGTVNAMNAISFCGKTDWAVNVETSIESRDCQGFTIKKGDVILDVYDDRDGTLFFGKKFALLLAGDGDRPSEIDEEVPYAKD